MMDLLSLFAQTEETAAVPLIEQSWFAAVMLIVFVVFSGLLGRFIARSVQMNDHGWKLGVVFFCIVFFSYYVATNWPPKFGVDLKGGVTFIVDLNLDNDPETVVDQWMSFDQDDDKRLSADEVPDDMRSQIAVIDKDDDGFASEAEIRAKAELDANEAGENQESVENVIDQLKKRIDPSGIYEVDLRALGDDQIEITIPGIEPGAQADRILERIKKAGYLQFRILALVSQESALIQAARDQANSPNADLRARTEVRSAGGSGDNILGRWVTVGRLDVKKARELGLPQPPFRYTIPYTQTGPDVLIRNSATGQIVDNLPFAPEGIPVDTPAYKRYANSPKLIAAFHSDWWQENIKKEYPNGQFQILVVEPPAKENVEGGDLIPNLVRSTTDRTGRPAVEFTLKKEGVPKFSRLTGNNIDKPLGMILDGELLSAPNINSKIYKNGIIEGDFTTQEVKDLISILKAGQLRTTLQSPDGGGDLIDSTMGREMKERGFWAIGVSFVLILIFLVAYYVIAGIVACLALILNLLMILGIIMILGQPLTLNGLAGLVLTVGMSVDANVLIFERIREELAKDATLRMAIRNGFQRATTTIVDANITTFITAFILYVIGNEQLKSFSVALMLGIVLSMFTAIFCSRIFFDIFEKKRWLKSLGSARMFTKSNVDFIGKRRLAFVVSVVFIAVGVGAMFYRGGTMLNHDLAGGSMAKVVFSEPTELADIKKVVDKISEENEVNKAPAVITVARIQSSQYPDKTYYRFESNIKSKDGSKSLSDLIKQHFGDQLAKQTVQIDVTSAPTTGGTPEAGNSGNPEDVDNKGPPKKENAAKASEADGNANLQLPQPQLIGELQNRRGLFPVSTIGQQEPEKSGDQPAAKQTQPKGDPPTKDQPKANETEVKQEKESNPEPGSDSSQDSTPKADQEPGKTDANATQPGDPNTTQDPKTKVPSDPSVERGSEFDPTSPTGPQDSNDLTPTSYVTKAKIEFGLTVDGSSMEKKATSLRGDFVDAARSLGFDNYTRENIKMRDPDGGGFISEGVDYESKVWDVEITTQGADHGERILEEMESTFNGMIFLPQAKEVGERFAQKAWLRAFAAMIASLIGIVAYIWIRFQRVSFGLAAVAALIHDVLVVLGAIAVSFWLKDFLGIILVEDFKISLAVIAALLTIIGYSLNDTIVVFDRIREVRGKNPLLSGDMVNRSINQTLSRTILTSLTTFIVVAILYGAGGDAIHGFAFALVVGVIVGTYSSIFVASPVLLMLMKGEPESDSAEA